MAVLLLSLLHSSLYYIINPFMISLFSLSLMPTRTIRNGRWKGKKRKKKDKRIITDRCSKWYVSHGNDKCDRELREVREGKELRGYGKGRDKGDRPRGIPRFSSLLDQRTNHTVHLQPTLSLLSIIHSTKFPFHTLVSRSQCMSREQKGEREANSPLSLYHVSYPVPSPHLSFPISDIISMYASLRVSNQGLIILLLPYCSFQSFLSYTFTFLLLYHPVPTWLSFIDRWRKILQNPSIRWKKNVGRDGFTKLLILLHCLSYFYLDFKYVSDYPDIPQWLNLQQVMVCVSALLTIPFILSSELCPGR